jgi:peptide/nickel transport system substrate-binding protein
MRRRIGRRPVGAERVRRGDRDLAARYFRAAGFASGRYEGDETVLLLGSTLDPERNVAQLAERQLQDPQTMLDPTFNGANIRATGNANWPELDDAKLNRAIERAKLVNEPHERA